MDDLIPYTLAGGKSMCRDIHGFPMIKADFTNFFIFYITLLIVPCHSVRIFPRVETTLPSRKILSGCMFKKH